MNSILRRTVYDNMISSCNSCDSTISLKSSSSHSSIISSSSSCCRFTFSSPTKNPNNLKGPVCFDAVTIRTYYLTLGDHPSCTKGPALSLSWEYQQYEEIPIDIFEEFREGQRGQSKHEMYISSQIRKDLVKRLNVSDEEIVERQNEIDEIKKQRLKTKVQMKKKNRRRKKLKKLLKNVARYMKQSAISLITQ